LLVERIEVLGWNAAEAATSAGVSRSTAYKWVKRFREEGLDGLEDRSCRPHRFPHRLGRREEREILRARRRTGRGPHHLARHPGSTSVYGLRGPSRHGMRRLDHADRPTGVPIRYCKDRPGELLHLDVRKCARVGPGGGHRMLGRSSKTGQRRSIRMGYDYLHVAVDDHSRVAYVRVFSDDRGETAARFVLEAGAHFAELGLHIERVMTDRAKCYVESRAFAEALERIGARHKPTRGYRPQTNGKAERFIRTMLAE
jgi:transposase InsO family protein